MLGAHESGYSAVCSEREVSCVFANTGSFLCAGCSKFPVCSEVEVLCALESGKFPVYSGREVLCAPESGKFLVYSQMLVSVPSKAGVSCVF